MRQPELRANVSKLSHAELEAYSEFDSGYPEELGAIYRELRHKMPDLTVLGGCCGTDTATLSKLPEHASWRQRKKGVTVKLKLLQGTQVSQ
jgi:methionine synthase I (cobalamin-dependent)